MLQLELKNEILQQERDILTLGLQRLPGKKQ
jgi:hypothetical protein